VRISCSGAAAAHDCGFSAPGYDRPGEDLRQLVGERFGRVEQRIGHARGLVGEAIAVHPFSADRRVVWLTLPQWYESGLYPPLRSVIDRMPHSLSRESPVCEPDRVARGP
jgi:hypothetical protein